MAHTDRMQPRPFPPCQLHNRPTLLDCSRGKDALRSTTECLGPIRELSLGGGRGDRYWLDRCPQLARAYMFQIGDSHINRVLLVSQVVEDNRWVVKYRLSIVFWMRYPDLPRMILGDDDRKG